MEDQQEMGERFRVSVVVELDVEAGDWGDAELLGSALVRKTIQQAAVDSGGELVLSMLLQGRRHEAALAGRIRSVNDAVRRGDLTIASTTQVARWKDGAK